MATGPESSGLMVGQGIRVGLGVARGVAAGPGLGKAPGVAVGAGLPCPAVGRIATWLSLGEASGFWDLARSLLTRAAGFRSGSSFMPGESLRVTASDWLRARETRTRATIPMVTPSSVAASGEMAMKTPGLSRP